MACYYVAYSLVLANDHVGMIITEHWDPDLYFGILKFISIYFKLVPGTTVPTEGLP
jgi:hypothetical protein